MRKEQDGGQLTGTLGIWGSQPISTLVERGVGTSVGTKFGTSGLPKVMSQCVLGWESKPGQGFSEQPCIWRFL